MTATNSPGAGSTGAAIRGARMTGAQAPGAQQRTANVVVAQRPFRQATRASRSTGRTSAFVSATHAALELHLARAQSSSMAASWTRAGGAPCPFTHCTTRGKGAILTRDGGAPCVTTEDVKQTSMRRAGCLASRGVPTLGWRALRLGAQAVNDTTLPRKQKRNNNDNNTSNDRNSNSTSRTNSNSNCSSNSNRERERGDINNTCMKALQVRDQRQPQQTTQAQKSSSQ